MRGGEKFYQRIDNTRKKNNKCCRTKITQNNGEHTQTMFWK